ncbi:hypothetical protein [Streptomyces sp. M7]|uniref:hypothetical protein n=1 Tax=Streptomyces sp. M7 TaxID=255705 RepID=UPI0011C060BB|nr:hypothetical protein [Streptomyces sp. M7]
MPGSAAGLLAQAVADTFGERLRALLERVESRRATGLEGGADVVALLSAEADVHRLADEVGDDGLDRGDRGFLHRLDDRLEQGLFQLVEEATDDEPGDLGGAETGDLGQAEGERGGGVRGDDLDCQGDQLGDDRPLGELDEVGAGLQHVCDEERGLGGVAEVTVASATAVELLVRLDELVDRLTGVVRGDLAGGAVRRAVQLGDLLTELPPHLGTVPELVLVRRGPSVAQHLENPLEFVRQHHRHSRKHPRQTERPYNSLTRPGKSHRSTAVRKVYGITVEPPQGGAVTSPFQVADVGGTVRREASAGAWSGLLSPPFGGLCSVGPIAVVGRANGPSRTRPGSGAGCPLPPAVRRSSVVPSHGALPTFAQQATGATLPAHDDA